MEFELEFVVSPFVLPTRDESLETLAQLRIREAARLLTTAYTSCSEQEWYGLHVILHDIEEGQCLRLNF